MEKPIWTVKLGKASYNDILSGKITNYASWNEFFTNRSLANEYASDLYFKLVEMLTNNGKTVITMNANREHGSYSFSSDNDFIFIIGVYLTENLIVEDLDNEKSLMNIAINAIGGIT